MERYVKAILIKPGKCPKLVVVANQLQDFQALVDGNIESVNLFDEPAAIICNEEGMIRNLPANLLIDHRFIYGSVVIVGVDGEEFCSLSDDQIRQYLVDLTEWMVMTR